MIGMGFMLRGGLGEEFMGVLELGLDGWCWVIWVIWVVECNDWGLLEIEFGHPLQRRQMLLHRFLSRSLSPGILFRFRFYFACGFRVPSCWGIVLNPNYDRMPWLHYLILFLIIGYNPTR